MSHSSSSPFPGFAMSLGNLQLKFRQRIAHSRNRLGPDLGVEALRRRVWEFTEELRANSILALEDRAL